MTIIDITARVLAVIAAGAYLRWGLLPARRAYEFGRLIERMDWQNRASQHTGQ